MSDSAGAVREVDPWRFTGGFLKTVLSGQIPDTPKHEPIPFAALTKPLSESKLALVSTAGLSMRGEEPFDMEFERQNPTKGDPSWRAIRADATGATIEANHLHIDTSYVRRDLNVALPVDRVRELVADGEVGGLAETHYSTMGYQGNDAKSQMERAPEIAACMRNEGVDLALLAPV